MLLGSRHPFAWRDLFLGVDAASSGWDGLPGIDAVTSGRDSLPGTDIASSGCDTLPDADAVSSGWDSPGRRRRLFRMGNLLGGRGQALQK